MAVRQSPPAGLTPPAMSRPDPRASALAASVYSPRARGPRWRLEDLLGARVRYYSYGRRALAEGLRAAGLGRGARILIPEYICRELLAAPAALGAQALLYPVAPDLRPVLDPGRWPQADAVVAVNYFGFAQDLAPFRAYAARTGALVVEDNAHGLFSRDATGALLGTRADLGIFSLRKTLLLPNGAALFAGQRGKLPPQETFRAQRGVRSGLKGALRAAARTLGARAAFRTLDALRDLRGTLKGRRLPLPDPEGERVMPQDPPCSVLASPLAKPSAAEETERRRKLYALAGALLEPIGVEPAFPSLPKETSPYVYPFRASPEDARRAEAALNASGLYSLPWPDLPEEVAPRAPEHYKNLYGVHFLW